MLRSQPSEERRGLNLSDANIEIRTPENAESRFFGYGAVFNTRTAIGNPLRWGFYEEVAPGTFTKTIAEGDQRMLIDHDSYYVVSRVSANTLYLAQDARGLTVDSALDEELSYVKDLKANLRNGNITGMSFGFQVVNDDWADEEVELSDGNSATVEVRTIREVKLFETSPVTFPAYEETTAGLRHSLVPALLRRGDQAAIARAAKYRPELAHLLGYDADRASVTIDLKGTNTDSTEVKSEDISDEVITDVQTDSEPGETTPDSDVTTDDERSDEPTDVTRIGPSQSELISLRMKMLKASLRTKS